jgi:hypothetical protein
MKNIDYASPDVAVGVAFSGGKSSLWLIHAMLRGILPRPRNLAVFTADTGLEHSWTYEEIERTEELCKSEGIEFVRCAREEDLGAHLLDVQNRTRADHPPVYIAKDGGGRGQAEHRCTREFKVAPMRRAQSAWLKRIGSPKKIIKWVGFAADEAHRGTKAVAKQDVQWERLEFPAIRLGMTRAMQEADLIKWTGRAPRFSMCTICPWKTPERWTATPPEQLQMVYEIDEAIRDMSSVGLTDGDAFLSDRLIPVEQLIRRGGPTPGKATKDAGCDGGYCFL